MQTPLQHRLGTPVNRLKRYSEAGTPFTGTPLSARRRNVRIKHKPLKQKVLEWFPNLWLSFEADFQAADFTSAGYPTGIALISFHILLRFVLSASSAISSSRARSNSAAEERLEELRRMTGTNSKSTLRSMGLSSLNLIAYLLIALSCANALYLFTRYRSYRMFLRSDPVSSPNAKMVNVDMAPVDEQPFWSQILQTVWHHTKIISGFNGNRKSKARQVQQLDVWQPSTFHLHLFSIYSPPIAILLQFMSRDNWLVFFCAALGILVQTYTVVYFYDRLLADRATIAAETLHEYDTKFVNPRINYARRDASTMTNEAEHISAEDWMTSSEVKHRNTGRRSMMF